MKCKMELIVYNGMDNPVFRKSWDMPDITADEFEPTKHIGKVFMYPEGTEPKIEGMYVWRHCRPSNKREEKKLIKMGKWGFCSPLTQPTPSI